VVADNAMQGGVIGRSLRGAFTNETPGRFPRCPVVRLIDCWAVVVLVGIVLEVERVVAVGTDYSSDMDGGVPGDYPDHLHFEAALGGEADCYHADFHKKMQILQIQ